MIWMHSSVAPRLEVALLLTAAFLRAGPSRPRAWIGALYAAGAIERLLWALREAGAGRGASLDWSGSSRCRAHSSSGHWRAASRRRFLRAAHWIILAVIVITGLAQSALARVLDPWIVTTRRAAIAHGDRSCLLAGVERMAGRSCRQACAAF